MHEDFLHFIWKYKLYTDFILFNANGSDIDILNQGKHNFDAGPDFLEAKIKNAEATWVGNIEVHIKSSDWYLHGHHLDKAYNNVILQVAKQHDKDIYSENGRLVPVLEVMISESMEKKYLEFLENKSWISCQNDISLVSGFKLKMWLGNVLIERLNKKAEYIVNLLKINKNSWEETFYQMLARSFGFKINAEPFEWLAKSIPLKYLSKHHSNLLQLEAFLFGQAGFLELDSISEKYYLDLRREYGFLKKKFKLKPIEKHLWKFLRLRPTNFPNIRIAQFAALIHKSKSLFSKILDSNELTEIRDFFKTKASSFWDTHYTFEKNADTKPKHLGVYSIDSILINTVLPVLFVYGQQTGNNIIQEKAINFFEEIKAERNKIINNWKQIGIQVPSSFYSQALIEQKKSYCDQVKCLTCGIGIEILKNQLPKL
jgi:hypothetical protein